MYYVINKQGKLKENKVTGSLEYIPYQGTSLSKAEEILVHCCSGYAIYTLANNIIYKTIENIE